METFETSVPGLIDTKVAALKTDLEPKITTNTNAITSINGEITDIKSDYYKKTDADAKFATKADWPRKEADLNSKDIKRLIF